VLTLTSPGHQGHIVAGLLDPGGGFLKRGAMRAKAMHSAEMLAGSIRVDPEQRNCLEKAGR
jgi:hypothetical protein